MTRDIAEVVRDEPRMRRRLLTLLADGPLTVPGLAEAGGLPAEDVMVWVMSMRKYGYLVEAGKDGDYFRYETVSRP